MIRADYWIIKEHTERKLEILDKYLNAWCDIFSRQYQNNPEWQAWQTPYYIDCFSGRGMYHKNGNLDSVKGSPIVAIEKFLDMKNQFQERCDLKLFPKIRLIEYVPEFYNELCSFVKPYQEFLDIKVFNADFNEVIGEIVKETGYSPAFFFVDAGGIKELKKASVDKIITKKGARDILLNYVVDGPLRIGGLARSIFDGSYKGKQLEGAFKTIERLEDFTGLEISQYMTENKDDNKDALINYVQNVLHANNKILKETDKLQTIVYDMKDVKRSKLVYYLLFSSRKAVATNIMKQIFQESKKTETNQISMFDSEIMQIK